LPNLTHRSQSLDESVANEALAVGCIIRSFVSKDSCNSRHGEKIRYSGSLRKEEVRRLELCGTYNFRFLVAVGPVRKNAENGGKTHTTSCKVILKLQVFEKMIPAQFIIGANSGSQY
jgi:hypothetical protein